MIGNGDVASLVFFAVWAVVALAGTVSIDGKRRRLLGAAVVAYALMLLGHADVIGVSPFPA